MKVWGGGLFSSSAQEHQENNQCAKSSEQMEFVEREPWNPKPLSFAYLFLWWREVVGPQNQQ